MDPVSTSRRAQSPAAPREPVPYVSPPSFRGVNYRGPVGYRHQDDRPWLLRSPVMLWTLVVATGLVLYARSEQWLPLVKGHSTTRVLSGQPRPPKDPFAGDAQWSTQPRHALALPDDLSRLPAPGAGDAGAAADRSVSAYKCALPDGTVEYRQQACEQAQSPQPPVTGLRPRRH